MPLVNVLINGRAYTVACDEGEEERLRELAQFLGKRVNEIVSTVGQVGEARLLLMAALIVCDELSEAFARLDEQGRELAALKEKLKGGAEVHAEEAVEVLERAAERIEAIAAKVG